MKMKSRMALSALVLVGSAMVSAEPIKRIQYPAMSPDGSTIVFSWQNDLWSVARTGGKAIRLTVHASTDTRPVWFPDGSRIAFSSNRYGSSDIFTMRPDGSDLKRVTYDSTSEFPSSVSADGRYVFGYGNQWSRGDAFKVPSTGGDLIRLTNHPFEIGFLPFVSGDNTKVYYNRGAYRDTAWQKPTMQSSALPEIWIADNTVPLSNHRRMTNNEFTDLSPQVLADGNIIAISNRDGWPNVWRFGKGDKQLTQHTNGTSRNASASKDGRYVSYEFESDLFVVDTFSGVDAMVNVEVPADDRNNPVQEITLGTGISAFAISQDGKRAVASARGDIFMLPEKGGTTRRMTTNPSNDLYPTWLDAKTMLYTAMEGGRRRLKTITIDGTRKDFFVDGSRDVQAAVVSPDGKSVIFHRGDNEIVIVDNAGAGERVLARGNFADSYESGALFTWSPDNKYIAVNFIEGRRTRVCLVEVKSGKQVTVAKMVNRPQRGSVTPPQFLANGRGVFFISPEFEDSDLFLVDLVPNDVTFTEDDLDKIDEAPKKDKPPVEVKVYEPGIDQRVRRLTRKGCITATPSTTGIYALTPEDGLVSVSTTTGSLTPLIARGPTTPSSIEFTNGKLYGIVNGQPVTITPGAPAATPIPFSATYTVNLKTEEKALFDEIWWALDRNYYDPKMHGKDWVAIREKFAKIVPYAYDRTDFYRMCGEMMEELDSSHLGATAPPAEQSGVGTESTAFLGIDLDPVALAAGNYVVGRVVPGSSADHPGSMLKVGDKLLQVDGDAVGAMPLGFLLNKKVAKKVTLTIERDGKRDTVVIRPGAQGQRGQLEYENFVSWQRAMVDKLSEGKLGYVHIASMDKPSLDRFLREIRTEGEGRKGIIIDVRFNGGGSTAVDVLGILIRTPWLMRTTRGEFGVKLSENIYRSDALEMPTALMSNTFSFSNAEVISEGFRKLRLGPIIGERTPGYVIGTGGYGLWDGGFIRMPVIGAYAMNGDNLENNGRRPDHTVWYDPNAWADGRDLQTEKAVAELLKGIK